MRRQGLGFVADRLGATIIVSQLPKLCGFSTDAYAHLDMDDVLTQVGSQLDAKRKARAQLDLDKLA